MPRYKISLHYPNGSTSHEITTSSALKARIWCVRILQDDDLREVTNRLLVTYGKDVLFDAPPSSIPYDDCEGVICWPTPNPRRIIDCTRATVTLPKAVLEKAREIGKGNASKGLLELVLTNRPELKQVCFTSLAGQETGKNEPVL
ncbi:MAG: hypothetical protein RR068_17635 [Hafnia sp.]